MKKRKKEMRVDRIHASIPIYDTEQYFTCWKLTVLKLNWFTCIRESYWTWTIHNIMAELQMMLVFLVFATLLQPFGVQLTLFLKSRAGSERNLYFANFYAKIIQLCRTNPALTWTKIAMV